MRRNNASSGTAHGGIVLTCLLGWGLSYYAFQVENAKEQDESYEAVCDVSEHVSCSKAFFSEYGKGFGLVPKDSWLYASNSLYGIVFYACVAVLNWYDSAVSVALMLFLAILANLGTIYLVYILYLLKNVCLVCVSLYVVDAMLLVFVVKKSRALFAKKAKPH
ncbi:vitamin K epoxide reductase complex subunit 1-like protein 1 [Orussus abietinus]|uniref:vitamin K epoxide reductase complex subunit 1-like protein 1 n=1 Tax=Orussus abietinus TaxID=222816 RepID=UPI00062548CB|nr:vitamin K epoxide reductase complex subunit 1-like protein 1 [Orussus abietinus]